MRFSGILLLVFGAVCTSEKAPDHVVRYIHGCYEGGDVRVDILIDDDELAFANFKKGKVEWMVPTVFSVGQQASMYALAELSREWCKRSMETAIGWDRPPKEKETPDSFVFTRDEVDLGVENTLLCFANHFYPPTMNITWTKNNVEVKEGVVQLRYHPNKDGTFSRMSTLRFTPEKGDIYSCTVDHQALDSPFTRFWEPELRESSVGPAVFFWVSLAVGLLGITAGTFFLFKQPME